MKRRRQRRGYRPTKHLSWKDSYVLWIPRQPCRWDILGYELSQALAEQCRRICPGLPERVLRFEDNQQHAVGRLLAHSFEVLVSQNWPRQPGEGWPSLWPIDDANVQAVSARAVRAFDGLLRKYLWDWAEVYLPRPDRDLEKLLRGLTGELREFLVKRCGQGKDLENCLLDPLGDDGGFFPKNDMPPLEGRASGDPAKDVRELALLVRDNDDAGVLKNKLVGFVRTDPWLLEELIIKVLEEVADEQKKESPADEQVISQQATDDFIFGATSLGGKSPIQLFLERQPDMPAHQRQRLDLWDREGFSGVFVVESVKGDFLTLEDLTTGNRLQTTMTDLSEAGKIHPDSILATRVVPWEDYWLLSGSQRYYDRLAPGAIQQTRRKALLRPMWRPERVEGERFAKAWQIQKEYHEAWMQLYGKDEMMFETGEQLQEAMLRFETFWIREYVQEDRGTTVAEKHRQIYGEATRTEPRLNLPDTLLKATDVAVLSDPRDGFDFLAGYGTFVRIFEGSGALTADQVERVWGYLTEDSITFQVFQRMKDRYPRRTEEVLRVVLRDQEFQLERDFDNALGTFKGSQIRHGRAPSVAVAGSLDQKK